MFPFVGIKLLQSGEYIVGYPVQSYSAGESVSKEGYQEREKILHLNMYAFRETVCEGALARGGRSGLGHKVRLEVLGNPGQYRQGKTFLADIDQTEKNHVHFLWNRHKGIQNSFMPVPEKVNMIFLWNRHKGIQNSAVEVYPS